MELTSKIVYGCFLVLVLLLVAGSVCSSTEEQETELQKAASDVVHVERRPLMGSAQIYWPHKHWWGKKKKKKPPPKRKRKPPPRRKPPRRVVHKPKPRVVKKWHPPKNHPVHIPGYKHNFDKPLHFVCNTAKGEGMVKVRSKYDNYYKDRVWDWKCGKVASGPLTECSWSPDINNWRASLTYMCPKNKFMAGIRSHHSNAQEDRRWRVRCCTAKDHHTEDCIMTDYVNMLHGDLDHKVGSQCAGAGAIVGMDSRWQHNDRRWKLFECNVAKEGSRRDSRRRRYHMDT